ncbi:MAG TPA: hypothetical protein VFU12_09375 [Glycomyces sp.]|nr:hypothetical protein [Glycomyces sp.]
MYPGQPHPQQHPHQLPPPQAQAPLRVDVRYKPSLSVMLIVAGSLFVLLATLLLALEERGSSWIVLGPIFIVMGVLSRSNHFLRFDIGQGTLYMYGPLGNRVRTYGAPKGERIVFDGANVMRLRADGTQKKVRTASTAHPEDLQRLQQTLWSLQQQPPMRPGA